MYLPGCQYLIYFFFPECSRGLYGVNCLQDCSMTCGISGNCDRITGYCQGGCQRGWTGVRCEEGKYYINKKSFISMYLHIVYKLHIIVLICDDSYIWYIIYNICHSVYWLIVSFELDAVRAMFKPPCSGLNGQNMII